jgi:cytokinin dehydrogenase
MSDTIVRRRFSTLARALGGDVVEPPPAAYGGDFGNVKRTSPQVLVRPRSVEDVQVTADFARRSGLRLVSRGHGCSSHGQSLSDGIVVDTARLAWCERCGEHAVSVGPGLTWGRFQDALVAQRRSSPVVVSNAHATVAGTVAVGGFGPTSVRQGAVADHVSRLRVVTGTGAVVSAERDGPADADLFRYTLCGLGQTGVIVGATLDVSDYRRDLSVEHRELPDQTDLKELGLSIAGDADVAFCRILFSFRRECWDVWLGRWMRSGAAPAAPGTRVSDYFRQIFAREETFAPGFAAGQVSFGILERPQDARRLWCDYVVPAEGAGRFARACRKWFGDPSLAVGLHGTVLAAAPLGTEALPLHPVPPVRPCVTLGVYLSLPPTRVGPYRARLDAAAALCHEVGGRQYLHGYHSAGPDFYSRQFGPETVSRWRAVKARHDPGSIMGAELFAP